MRVALNLEQCFQRPPGGIGRYAVELARFLPETDDSSGRRVEVVPFVARHSASEIESVWPRPGIAAAPLVLRAPRLALYELWNRWGRADPLSAVGFSSLRD